MILLLLLIGLVLLFLLLGSHKTHEGLGGSEVTFIQNQISVLEDVKERINRIPTYVFAHEPRNAVNSNIISVSNRLKTWLERRITYLNINDGGEVAPPSDTTMDALRKMWSDNGRGMITLIRSSVDRLDPVNQTQSEIIVILEQLINDMNKELNISLISTNPKEIEITGLE